MDEKKMKVCKKCKESINKKAKMCPHCRAKQGMPIWLIIVIVIACISIISSLGGNSDESSIDGTTNQNEKSIEYIKVSVDDLDDALENNAASAKDTYNKKYVEVAGRLGTIDSDLKYISLLSTTDEWDLMGIHCDIKSKAQKDVVKTLSKDQDITIKGKITDVGEVLGYYLDIIEIIPN